VGVGIAVVAAGASALGVTLANGSPTPGTHLPVVSGRTSRPETTTSKPTSTSTTLETVPPGVPIAVPARGLGIGSSDPAVREIKQRLTDLRYDPGTVNDRFDQQTYYAVIAFEKVHAMSRTGRVTQDVADAVAADNLAAPLIPRAESTRVEIDLTRQVLFFWINGRLSRILPVSSGFGGHYCGDDGSCGIAVTPIGAYRATSKIRGEHKSPLGLLWNPVFFNQGIAIHGEPSVPSTPASHGCVRIPMNDSPWLYDTLALGIPVYVSDSTHVPIPFNQGGTVGPVQPGGTAATVPHRTTIAPKSVTPPPASPAPTTATTSATATTPTTQRAEPTKPPANIPSTTTPLTTTPSTIHH
jgi:peptidoglycan hydrolase-like protein with peptidoglycan-binding domain